MGSLGLPVWQWVAGLGAAAVLAIGALLAPASVKAKVSRFRWWFAGLGVLLLSWFFLVFLRLRLPSDRFPTSALPVEFQPHYWLWMFVFLIGAMVSAVGVVTQVRLAKGRTGADPEGGRFPDIDFAWEDILLRLDQARIVAGEQAMTLLIAPTSADVAALIESAGLQIFARGPADEAPIHAFATADGVFLDCSGASHFGSPDASDATARIEHLNRRLMALRPDCPNVRAVVVILPIDWCSRPESIKQAAAIRDDLLAIGRILDLRCPTFAIFAGMEVVPGFLDFANRLGTQVSRQMLDQRVGFAVPGSQEFSGELMQRGLIWQSGWFHVWALNLLAGDPLNFRENAEIVTLEAEFRRYRRRLRSLLEAAFSSHSGATPVLFRGCYFVATGTQKNERGFSAGLLRGPRSRIVADGIAADWTDEADRADRRYTRASLLIGGVGLAGCLVTWAFIVSRAPVLGWAGLAALAVSWLVAAIRWLRRG